MSRVFFGSNLESAKMLDHKSWRGSTKETRRAGQVKLSWPIQNGPPVAV